MTRTAGWMGWMLGITLLLGVVTGERGSTLGVAAGLALLLGWASWATLRRKSAGQTVLCVLSFVSLAGALPRYFQTYEVWPSLVVILFGSLALGFGVTGMVLDRFGDGGRVGRGL